MNGFGPVVTTLTHAGCAGAVAHRPTGQLDPQFAAISWDFCNDNTCISRSSASSYRYMLSQHALRAFGRVAARPQAQSNRSNRSPLKCPDPVNVTIILNGSSRASSSSTRWKSRQGRDSFAREAKVQGLKSRAAFKLLEVGSGF